MGATKAKIEEFTKVHDDYIRALCEYVPPADRKPLMEESVQKAADIVSKVESLTDADLSKAIEAIQEAQKNITIPKGACSQECFMNLLRMQDLVMREAQTKTNDHRVQIGVLELTNNIVSTAAFMMLDMAKVENEATWQVAEKTHKAIMAAIDLLEKLRTTIQAGRVMAIELPAADKEKYKEFLN